MRKLIAIFSGPIGFAPPVIDIGPTMMPRLVVLWLAAVSASEERHERYLVKPTTEVSAVNGTEQPESGVGKLLLAEGGDLVPGHSSLHPVSQRTIYKIS